MNHKTKLLSEHLAEAEETRKPVRPLTVVEPSLSVEEAYYIQLETIQRKVAGGQKIVGKKIGLTSKAMQELLGVNEPDYGHLLDQMMVENGGNISFDKVLQPRVEGEIAFVLKRDVKGPNVTARDVLEATEYVVASLEIVDSRIKDWKITLPDTIADNASSGLFVLGETRVFTDQVDLPKIKMELYKNGELINTGEGSAVLGDPAYCVAWLANKLSEFNIVLHAGEVILSGALSAAIEAKPGDEFLAKFDHLGEVNVTFSV